MKLIDKLKTLLRAKASPSNVGHRRVPIPKRRPTPQDDAGASLDPAAAGWGFKLEPAEKAKELTGEYLEQLALEAYLNGPAFAFSDEELTSRFEAYFDRLVERGELQRVESPVDGGRVQSWIQAQQTRIVTLIVWWQAHGGPDIEARVL